jgi:hypothetical protein
MYTLYNNSISNIDDRVDTNYTTTILTGLSYSTAQSIIFAYDVNTYIIGRVVSYNSTTGVIEIYITEVSGGGSYDRWYINLYATGSGGGGTTSSIDVSDGTTTVSSISLINFSGATVSSGTSGIALVTITGGGGGSGTSGSSGSSGISGTSGSSGSSGVNGSSGSSGSSGLNGTSGSSGLSGTSGTSGGSGANGSSGSSGTSGAASGVPRMYQLTITYTSNIMDAFGGSQTAVGPNGESLAQLITAGWSFTKVDGTTLSIGRPSGLQVQPLVNIMTHGVNSTSVWSKSPTGVNTSSLSALQTISGGAFTTLTLYGLNSSNTGLVSSGSTTLTITFGLIS